MSFSIYIYNVNVVYSTCDVDKGGSSGKLSYKVTRFAPDTKDHDGPVKFLTARHQKGQHQEPSSSSIASKNSIFGFGIKVPEFKIPYIGKRSRSTELVIVDNTRDEEKSMFFRPNLFLCGFSFI